MSLNRFAVVLLGAAPVLVVPAHAQTPPLEGEHEVTRSWSASNAPPGSFGDGVLSDAGAATHKAGSRAPARFEGTFTQTRRGAAGGARNGFSATAAHEITGNLVWTPDGHPAHPKTFGDVDSQFYVPTDGELRVDVKIEAQSQAGTCTRDATKTFAVRKLPPAALQNVYLEVAADGRYNLRLGMISYFLPVEAAQRCSFKASSEAAPINDVGVVIGPQHGTMTGDAIVGATEQPIVYGVNSYSGEWDFKKVD